MIEPKASPEAKTMLRCCSTRLLAHSLARARSCERLPKGNNAPPEQAAQRNREEYSAERSCTARPVFDRRIRFSGCDQPGPMPAMRMAIITSHERLREE